MYIYTYEHTCMHTYIATVAILCIIARIYITTEHIADHLHTWNWIFTVIPDVNMLLSMNN